MVPPATGGHSAWHCAFVVQKPHVMPPLLLPLPPPLPLLPLELPELLPLPEPLATPPLPLPPPLTGPRPLEPLEPLEPLDPLDPPEPDEPMPPLLLPLLDPEAPPPSPDPSGTDDTVEPLHPQKNATAATTDPAVRTPTRDARNIAHSGITAPPAPSN